MTHFQFQQQPFMIWFFDQFSVYIRILFSMTDEWFVHFLPFIFLLYSHALQNSKQSIRCIWYQGDGETSSGMHRSIAHPKIIISSARWWWVRIQVRAFTWYNYRHIIIASLSLWFLLQNKTITVQSIENDSSQIATLNSSDIIIQNHDINDISRFETRRSRDIWIVVKFSRRRPNNRVKMPVNAGTDSPKKLPEPAQAPYT